jgi:hypothetical protein
VKKATKRAKKKRSRAGSPPGGADVPNSLRAFYAKPERTERLSALKKLASRSLSLRGESVLLQRDLAIALHAVARDRDALAVADWPQRAVVFRGKYAAWYAANAAWAVTARIRRIRGESARAQADLRRFVERPSHALLLQPQLWNEARLRQVCDTEIVRFDESSSGQDALDTDSMAWAVGELVFLRETAAPPFPHAAFDLSWLDDAIEALLERLARHLEREV